MTTPVDQIVIQDDRGEEHRIRLYPGMRREQLSNQADRLGIKEIRKAWLHGDEKHCGGYASLVQSVWPDLKFEELPATEPGTYRVAGHGKCTVNLHYFRAVAKLAFHYYLAHSRRGFRGDEVSFSSLRKFIMEGGEVEEFFHSSGRTFALPFGELPSGVLCPAQWCHVLAADETADVAVVYVRLFIGPGSVRPPHYITLGPTCSKVYAPTFRWAHVYLYDEFQPSTGYAGRVETASVFQLS